MRELSDKARAKMSAGGKKGKTGGFAYLAEHDPEKLKKIATLGGKKGKK